MLYVLLRQGMFHSCKSIYSTLFDLTLNDEFCAALSDYPASPLTGIIQFRKHAQEMSSSFRWRTIIEVAVISIVIYIFIGTPGISNTFLTSTTTENDVPDIQAKAESLVYPDLSLTCPKHDVDIHIFSTSPLVIYVDGFLSSSEAQHLVDIRYVIRETSRNLSI